MGCREGVSAEPAGLGSLLSGCWQNSPPSVLGTSTVLCSLSPFFSTPSHLCSDSVSLWLFVVQFQARLSGWLWFEAEAPDTPTARGEFSLQEQGRCGEMLWEQLGAGSKLGAQE